MHQQRKHRNLPKFAQVHDIVRTVDLDCDGYVSWEEFKHAFFEPSESVT